MINSDIRTEKALEGKANYVVILRHFESLITTCYNYHFLGSTPAASTIRRALRLTPGLLMVNHLTKIFKESLRNRSGEWCPEPVEGHQPNCLIIDKNLCEISTANVLYPFFLYPRMFRWIILYRINLQS